MAWEEVTYFRSGYAAGSHHIESMWYLEFNKTQFSAAFCSYYINDVGWWVNSTIKLFADDCNLLRQINTKTDSITLQQDLGIVVQWSKKWQMSFNPQKCSVLTVTKKKKIIFHHYKMCGVELAHVNRQAYLGLELASDLTWGPNI